MRLKLTFNPYKMTDNAAYLNVLLKGDVVDVMESQPKVPRSLTPGVKHTGNYSFSSSMEVVEAVPFNEQLK